jgi:hypothetical protein
MPSDLLAAPSMPRKAGYYRPSSCSSFVLHRRVIMELGALQLQQLLVIDQDSG